MYINIKKQYSLELKSIYMKKLIFCKCEIENIGTDNHTCMNESIICNNK